MFSHVDGEKKNVDEMNELYRGDRLAPLPLRDWTHDHDANMKENNAFFVYVGLVCR